MKKRILIIFALLLLFSANSVLGATFGYETIGAFGNTTLNKISGTLSTLSVAGSVEKISVYFKDVFGESVHKSGIYDNDGNFIAETQELTNTTGTDTWYDFNFTEPIDLDEGDYYLVIMGKNEGIISIDYPEPAEISMFEWIRDYDSGFPSFYDKSKDTEVAISIYATYTLQPPPPPPFVETDENFVAGIISYVRSFLGSGIFPFLAMVIGIPLAFVVINRVITLVPTKK